MGAKICITSALLLCLLAHVQSHEPGVFDVTNYGAKPDADICEALKCAWKEACACTEPSVVVIPAGTFVTNEVVFEGPCKAPVEFRLQGTLKAPPLDQMKGDKGWLSFNRLENLRVTGGGTFDGQGKDAWAKNECHQKKDCKQHPNNLSFNFVTNSVISDVTTLDSKEFHVSVFAAKNVTFEKFNVCAPADSPNTDGIHIGRSNGVTIIDSVIKTGDDCISLGDGSKDIHIEKVTCGPGHGISVGSLGRYEKEEDVAGVFVKNCTLLGTTNGVRIKTWPSCPAGVATDMHFEDLIMDNVANPVLIDQVYCPHNQCKAEVPSSVKLSKISFKNIRGTSTTQAAVKLACSKKFPCQDVEIADIDLTYNGSEGPAKAECNDVHPTFTGTMNPPACTCT